MSASEKSCCTDRSFCSQDGQAALQRRDGRSTKVASPALKLGSLSKMPIED
jgi:hypothetical protein